jgi:hypothetical protein
MMVFDDGMYDVVDVVIVEQRRIKQRMKDLHE